MRAALSRVEARVGPPRHGLPGRLLGLGGAVAAALTAMGAVVLMVFVKPWAGAALLAGYGLLFVLLPALLVVLGLVALVRRWGQAALASWTAMWCLGAITALDNVDFHVDYGEVVGVVGDNGAGGTLIFTFAFPVRIDAVGILEDFTA